MFFRHYLPNSDQLQPLGHLVTIDHLAKYKLGQYHYQPNKGRQCHQVKVGHYGQIWLISGTGRSRIWPKERGFGFSRYIFWWPSYFLIINVLDQRAYVCIYVLACTICMCYILLQYFYICNTCVRYTPVLHMQIYTCITLYTCSIGVLITCVIHQNTAHVLYMYHIIHMWYISQCRPQRSTMLWGIPSYHYVMGHTK